MRKYKYILYCNIFFKQSIDILFPWEIYFNEMTLESIVKYVYFSHDLMWRLKLWSFVH
jgi:hypothetical protein